MKSSDSGGCEGRRTWRPPSLAPAPLFPSCPPEPDITARHKTGARLARPTLSFSLSLCYSFLVPLALAGIEGCQCRNLYQTMPLSRGLHPRRSIRLQYTEYSTSLTCAAHCNPPHPPPSEIFSGPPRSLGEKQNRAGVCRIAAVGVLYYCMSTEYEPIHRCHSRDTTVNSVMLRIWRTALNNCGKE